MTNMKATKRALVSSVLALFLCFAMLLGTTYAWFTDEVSSEGNIIQTGTLDVIMEYADGTVAPDAATWNDAAKGKIFNYDNWEPGYVDAKHIKITNVGSLALNYYLRVTADSEISKLAEVIDVYYFAEATALDRAKVEDGVLLGTLEQIMGTAKNISNTVKGTLVPAGEETTELNSVRTLTLALKMQEDAGNEYQNLSIGDGFAVELIATQATFEEDAFDDQYDAVVPNPGIPAALVMPIDPDEEFKSPADSVVIVGENLLIDTTGSKMGEDLGKLPLDAAYQFEPTMSYDEAQQSEYRYWHADFVVSADKDVPANSIALAGYYEAWCALNNDKWVALTADTDIAAGTEIRLVEGMGGGTYYVNWEELCYYGNDDVGFICGLAALDAAALAGTTVTVELRIYETTLPWYENSGSANEETGDYEIAGTFTYTFPAYKVNNQAELDAAIADGAKVIDLPAGEYVLSGDNDLVVIGSGANTVIDINGNIQNANITNATVTGDSSLNVQTDDTAVFTNVVFSGNVGNVSQGVVNGDTTFTNCTFNAGVHVDDSVAGTNITFEGCTFAETGYIKLGGSATYSMNKCTVEELASGAAGPWGKQWLIVYSDITFTECTIDRLIRAGASINITLDSCVYGDDTAIVDDNVIYKADGVNYNNPVVTIK